MRARLARLFLVVALLAGWQAALVHPLEHVDEHGHFVHFGHAQHAHCDEGEGAPSDPLDKLCDALGALVACAPQEAKALPFPASTLAASRPPLRVPRPAEPVPFLSQGPPTLL